MKPNPLLIVTPKTYNGGAENVAAKLSRHFDKKVDVTVATFDDSRTDYEYAGKLVVTDAPMSGSLPVRLKGVVKSTLGLRDVKKSLKPVASISLIGGPNIANVFSRQGELCIVSVRTYMRRSPSKIKHFFQKLLVRLVYNKADKVVAICEGVKKDLVDYYHVNPEKVSVIYPYFDVDAIQKKSLEPVEAEWQHVFSGPVVITAGRLTYDKGQWHLIKAFSEVKKKVPEASLVILGRGDMKDQLVELAKRTGYGQDIHFMGYCDNPFKYIRAATVFAFPSLIEGFGNALGEALACGTPAVAADCDVGPREILAPERDPHAKATGLERCKAGYLVPAFDGQCDLDVSTISEHEKLMAEALVKVLADQALRDEMSSHASKRALCFDVEAVSGKWDALLDK